MNVYVAGAYCDKPTVQQVQNELRKIGCTITHDWTTAAHATALEDALADERGVNQADVVVVVFSVADHAYRGTFTEMGMALGLRKLVFALCLTDGDYKHNPFLQLPQVRMTRQLDELANLVKEIPYEERLALFLQRPRLDERHYVPIQETPDHTTTTSGDHTENSETL